MKWSGCIYEEEHNKGKCYYRTRWTGELRFNGKRYRRRFKEKEKARLWVLNKMNELHIMRTRRCHSF